MNIKRENLIKNIKENMIKEIKEYGMQLWRQKIRLVLGGVIFLILFLLSCKYMYTGINKRFILFSALSLATALLVVCPKIKKWFVSVPLLVVYLLLVPVKLFQRMEIPLHDMSRIMDGAMLVNVLMILLIYAVFLLISQRVSYALAGGNILLLVLSVVNFYLFQFRGSTLSLDDILATGTALTVVGNYEFVMETELWYSILYFCFFIAWALWCDVPGKGKKYHLGVTCTALLYMGLFGWFWGKSDYLEEHELQWWFSDNQKINGFLLTFGLNIKEASMDKPEGYSEQAVLEIAKEAADSYVSRNVSEVEKPNIIFIMNEAWSDLRSLGNLETSDEYMPFVNSMDENVIKGNTHVSVLGGLTANSEFEVLTGDTLTFFLPTVVPYNVQVRRDLYSMARVLGEQGYSTAAMHPNAGVSWNRDKVYEYFGFEEFVELEDYQTELSYIGSFVSDASNFNEIIRHYENRDKDKPYFLFNVSIQNHSSYYEQVDRVIKIEKVGNTPVSEVPYIKDAETYINLMKITDDAFRELIAYFEGVEEPTIICMFGDHQPVLSDYFYEAMFADSELTEEEQLEQKYITPYVIWTNYASDFTEYGDMSVSFLGAVLMECAGLELPDYYKFLLQLQTEYLLVTRWNVENPEAAERIKQYRILEYNHLIDKNSEKSVFSLQP